jgi:hypothetical protein
LARCASPGRASEGQACPALVAVAMPAGQIRGLARWRRASAVLAWQIVKPRSGPDLTQKGEA